MSLRPATEFVLRREVVRNKIAQLLSEFRQTILHSLNKPFEAHQSYSWSPYCESDYNALELLVVVVVVRVSRRSQLIRVSRSRQSFCNS